MSVTRRRYYRFRAARFYGGMATADCVGCNLRCIFYWSWEKVVNAARWLDGEDSNPCEVVERLVDIANRTGTRKLLISGGESTMCGQDLLRSWKTLTAGTLHSGNQRHPRR